MGLSWPSLHTWICMSVLHEAKDSSHFQSTSTHNNQSISCADESQTFYVNRQRSPSILGGAEAGSSQTGEQNDENYQTIPYHC